MSRQPKGQISLDDWHGCSDPHRLVRWSRRVGNARKYLLLGCAIVRNWPGSIQTDLGRGMLDDIEALARRPGGLNSTVRLVEDVLRHRAPLLTSGMWSMGENVRVQHLLGEDAHWFVHFFNSAAAPSRTTKTLVNNLIHRSVAVARWAVGKEVETEVELIRKDLTRQANTGIMVAQLASLGSWLFGSSNNDLCAAILARIPERLRVGVTNVVQARARLHTYRDNQKGVSAKMALSALVREVFGYPFQPWQVRPEWLARHDGAVHSIAEHIDRSGNFAEMPFLGDALEDAGCEDALVLEHCRSGESHTFGCWVIDAVLRR